MSRPKVGTGLALEWSHDAPRPTVRADEIPELPTRTEADRDPLTKRFVAGNTAARDRTLRKAAREQALLGLDPSKAAEWMQPYIPHAQTYAAALIAALPEQSAALNALAGDAATAAAIYRGLLARAVSGDVEALREARAWLREHRQTIATLSALAGRKIAIDDDPHAALDAAIAAEKAP